MEDKGNMVGPEEPMRIEELRELRNQRPWKRFLTLTSRKR